MLNSVCVICITCDRHIFYLIFFLEKRQKLHLKTKINAIFFSARKRHIAHKNSISIALKWHFLQFEKKHIELSCIANDSLFTNTQSLDRIGPLPSLTYTHTHSPLPALY